MSSSSSKLGSGIVSGSGEFINADEAKYEVEETSGEAWGERFLEFFFGVRSFEALEEDFFDEGCKFGDDTCDRFGEEFSGDMARDEVDGTARIPFRIIEELFSIEIFPVGVETLERVVVVRISVNTQQSTRLLKPYLRLFSCYV